MNTRSVLECGVGTDHVGIRPNERLSLGESARGLAQSNTWRTVAPPLGPPESTPTGLHRSAQGCEARATLGGPAKCSSTLKGLQHVVSFGRTFLRRLQPRWGCFLFRTLTQGSSFVATLGWRTESRWDSTNRTTDFCARANQEAGIRAGVCLIALLLCSATLVHAQSYSIDWHTIAGGGGTSTGGVYSVTGTLGQPDASGPLTNGQYSVTGGFWALLITVPTPGTPMLVIVPAAPGTATILWTPATPGFVLQETLSLSPAAWSSSPSGATNPITVPVLLPMKFYRLFQP